MIEEESENDKTPVVPVLRPFTHAERLQRFGHFRFMPAPVPNDKERIRILDGWVAENIISVAIPELGGRPVWVHRLIADKVQALFAAWKAAGLISRIRSFDGAFCARYKRKRAWGGPENLSNHSWGTALDINARWNPIGHEPAALDTEGCTRELVQVAYERGFVWGGNFAAPYTDGMHFEIGQLIEPPCPTPKS